MLIAPVTPIPADLIPVLSSCSMTDQSTGSHDDRIPSLFQLRRLNIWFQTREEKRLCTSVISFRISDFPNKDLPTSMRTIWRLWTCPSILSVVNTPHIDIRRHYVRELALGGLIKLIPLGTYDMVADALTKSLPTPALTRHREVMMGHQRFQPFYASS